MKVVFIHGRSQEAKDPVALQATWTRAMNEGLASLVGAAAPAPEILFPYYGDLLFKETERLARAEFQTLVDKGADQAGPGAEEQQFVQELVFAMAQREGVTQEQISREANGDVVDRGIQNWRGVLAALRLLNEVPGVASTSVERFTRDVWCYLSNTGVRRAVNEVVAAKVPKDEPCVVVAHSLGTIVAYNVLMNMADRAHIRKFITIGSPLGIETIYTRLPSDTPPRRAPAGVADWFNARDDRDVVALFEVPAGRYRGDPAVRNYSGVDNRSENRHGIEEYLRDRKVAQELRSVL